MSAYSFEGRSRIWRPRDSDESSAFFSAFKLESEKLTSDIQPIYIDNVEYKEDKWSTEQLIQLLRFYGSHRCLWDNSSPENRNRMMRKAALADIRAALGCDITRPELVQKINVIRATYRYEKLRIKQRMRNGIRAKTKLKWFALADGFLRNVSRAKKNRNFKGSNSDSDVEDTVVSTIDPVAILPLSFDGNDSGSELQLNINRATAQAEQVSSNRYNSETILNRDSKIICKRPWTSQDTINFVEHIKIFASIPTLMTENGSVEALTVIQNLSNKLNLPVERLKRLLENFQQILQVEQLKILSDTNYKPNIIWWPEVEPNLKQIIKNIECLLIKPFMDPSSSDHVSTEDKNSSGTTIQSKFVLSEFNDNLFEAKWPFKYSVKFLRLYGAHRCLWDLKHPKYRSQQFRHAAAEDIAAAMGHGLTAEYVVKKINIFRITYLQHRKRMLDSCKASQRPEVQLRWFPLADCFLRRHIGLRSIKSKEVPQYDFAYVYANLNLIDPTLLTDLHGKGTQNTIKIGYD